MIKPIVISIYLSLCVLAGGLFSADGAGDAGNALGNTAVAQVIVPISISLTANGNMLDFRYRVTDEAKASEMLTHKNKPYLLIESDGTKTGVLKSPKLGSLRTTRPHQTGKGYFMLFGNPGKKLKAGDLVTIVIGDYKAEHLRVK